MRVHAMPAFEHHFGGICSAVLYYTPGAQCPAFSGTELSSDEEFFPSGRKQRRDALFTNSRPYFPTAVDRHLPLPSFAVIATLPWASQWGVVACAINSHL